MTQQRIAVFCIVLCASAAIAGTWIPAATSAPRPKVAALASQAGAAPKANLEREGDELERSYAEIDKAYQTAKRAAADDLDQRRKQGEKIAEGEIQNVAGEYWPRFQALADKGSGHARLWMALEMQAAFKSRERALNQRESTKLLEDVASQHADAPWIGELAKSLTALYIMLLEEDVDRVVDILAEKSTRREVVAEALYRSAAFGRTSKRPAAPARADELMKRIQRDYADTEYGRKGRGEETRAVGLKVGNLAPDFTTKDTEGVSFKLSDYRGKVVVLDFWGFW